MQNDDTSKKSKPIVIVGIMAISSGFMSVAKYGERLHGVIFFFEVALKALELGEKSMPYGEKTLVWLDSVRDTNMKSLRMAIADEQPYNPMMAPHPQSYINNTFAMGATGPHSLPPITISGGIQAGSSSVSGSIT